MRPPRACSSRPATGTTGSTSTRPGSATACAGWPGARHVPLAALLNHVYGAALVLERVEELRGDPPGIIAFRAARR